MVAYALTIFIGAFLLFQVQPLMGKFILPWFGGGPGVWTTCMLFFQVLLLGGYAYAHLSTRWLKTRTQVLLHLVLLIAAVAWLLMIPPSDFWKPQGGGNPTMQILVLLAATLGMPYFVLSATGPLVQQWFSRANPSRSPYRLYALSNVGSLLALLSYPFFFERFFTRREQAWMWAAGVVVYVLCCGFCVLRLWKTEVHSPQSTVHSRESVHSPQSTVHGPESVVGDSLSDSTQHATRNTQSPATIQSPVSNVQNPSFLSRMFWLLLPACASALLLATTNKMCQDVAVIPFLWVLPLALYLLSFIICFDSPHWYLRFPFTLALVAAFTAVCWALFEGTNMSIRKQVVVYSTGLFVCCMVCHGELYRLRPDPRYLTSFYLMISAGGALGGIFVAVLAPLLFTDYFELHWGLVMGALLFVVVCASDSTKHILSEPAVAGHSGAARWVFGLLDDRPILKSALMLVAFFGLIAGLKPLLLAPLFNIFGLEPDGDNPNLSHFIRSVVALSSVALIVTGLIIRKSFAAAHYWPLMGGLVPIGILAGQTGLTAHSLDSLHWQGPLAVSLVIWLPLTLVTATWILGQSNEWRLMACALTVVVFAGFDRFFALLGPGLKPSAARMYPGLVSLADRMARGLDRVVGHFGAHAGTVDGLLMVRIGMWSVLAMVVLTWVLTGRFKRFRYWRWMTCVWLMMGLVALGIALARQTLNTSGTVISRSRNFYGVLTVRYFHKDEDPENDYFELQHGRIIHGIQFTNPEKAREPTTYYTSESGIGLAFQALPKGPRHIGVIGLGTGSSTVYGRPGDRFRIYEINRAVERLATSRFTYLELCRRTNAPVTVVLGDARLSMEDELKRGEPQQFDMLVLDAFSGDAIPVHLLTKESLALYTQHLKPSGIIAVHISNRYLDLEPVVINLARALHFHRAGVDYEEDTDWFYPSTWILLSRDEAAFDTAPIHDAVAAHEPDETKASAKARKMRLWTDDFTSLYEILK